MAREGGARAVGARFRRATARGRAWGAVVCRFGWGGGVGGCGGRMAPLSCCCWCHSVARASSFRESFSSWRMDARRDGASRGCWTACSAMAAIRQAKNAAKAWARGQGSCAGFIVRNIY